MQGQEQDPNSVLGRVRDIRRQWAVQEDEALAYRLQDEEIAQHYNSNRTRNAIVREDAPKAREAQRQEELEALEERLKHLSVLQKQAENDAKIAKQLAKRDSEASKPKKPPHSPTNTSNEVFKDKSPHELLQQVTNEVIISNFKPIKSPLLGAGAVPVNLEDKPGPSRLCFGNYHDQKVQPEVGIEEEPRKLQEEKDAAMARALQEEMDRYERDKVMALEAQDRELARMLHEKDKARIRKAKEKARLKAEAAAALENVDVSENDCGETRTSSRNSSSSERPRSTDVTPPKLPVKLRSPQPDPIGFRAHPKPLPPHPPLQEIRSTSASPQSRLEHSRLPVDPVPPYMPIHGYNRSNSKRK